MIQPTRQHRQITPLLWYNVDIIQDWIVEQNLRLDSAGFYQNFQIYSSSYGIHLGLDHWSKKSNSFLYTLTVSHSNHYTRMFLCSCSCSYNWIVFMNGVFYPNSSNSFNWTKIFSLWKKTNKIERGNKLTPFGINKWHHRVLTSVLNIIRAFPHFSHQQQQQMQKRNMEMCCCSNRVFHNLDEIGNNANIGIRVFTTWKKFSEKMLPPSGNRTRASHSLWFQVQHYPFYINLTCAA